MKLCLSKSHTKNDVGGGSSYSNKNSSIMASQYLAPQPGIEPGTNRLTVCCTTAVLLWNGLGVMNDGDARSL